MESSLWCSTPASAMELRYCDPAAVLSGRSAPMCSGGTDRTALLGSSGPPQGRLPPPCSPPNRMPSG